MFHRKQNIDQKYPAKLLKDAFCMSVVNKVIQSCEMQTKEILQCIVLASFIATYFKNVPSQVKY